MKALAKCTRVVNLISGNQLSQYDDPSVRMELLIEWLSNPLPTEWPSFCLFASPTSDEELTLAYLDAESTDCVVYMVKLVVPISEVDLLNEFPPLLEICDITTGEVILSPNKTGKTSLDYDPLLNRDIDPITVPTLENIERALNQFGPRNYVCPPWWPYFIFEDFQRQKVIGSWEELLIKMRPGEVKTIYIYYDFTDHDKWTNPGFVREPVPPLYAGVHKFNYVPYFAALDYVEIEEGTGWYAKML